MTLAEMLTGLGLLDHDAPTQPLTAAGAHRIMRDHLECSAERCAAKFYAFSLLVEFGELQPDRDHDPRRFR